MKSPPITMLAMSYSTVLGSVLGGSGLAATMVACTAPGWSTRNTRGLACAGAGGIAAAAAPAAGACQSPKYFSSSGRISFIVVSPTTTRVASCGRSACACQASRSARVSAAIEASVPLRGAA